MPRKPHGRLPMRKDLGDNPPKCHDSLQFHKIYEELRRLAISQLRRLSSGQTLNVTALVNEAYLKLLNSGQHRWSSPDQCSNSLAVAADAMRQVVIDYYRRNRRVKRGGHAIRLSLELDTLPGVTS